MATDDPGRSCPLSYRTTPEGLSDAPLLEAETLYVVGGLYGNHQALDALHALARTERQRGLPEPVLVFNGDFNWFNAEHDRLRAINQQVLEHPALAGNVEVELADPDPAAGCGCAYPDWVDDRMVERSNRIMERLQGVIAHEPDLRRQLQGLPRQLRARVGHEEIGIVHGDPESLAGWGLAVEAMPEPGTEDPVIRDWFERAGVDLLACTHTCLPFLQDFRVRDQRSLVVNNGSAGMPNFRGDRRGLVTRLSLHPAPVPPVLGTALGELHADLLGLDAITSEWLTWFEHQWPPGSPAHESYWNRLVHGPSHDPDRAWRVRFSPS
jgi:hypothetical protein